MGSQFITSFILQILRCLKESCVILLDIVFGIAMNIIRIKWTSSRSRYYLVNHSLLIPFFSGSLLNLENYFVEFRWHYGWWCLIKNLICVDSFCKRPGYE